MAPIRITEVRKLGPGGPQVELQFLPASDEGSYRDPESQKALGNVESALRSAGMAVKSRTHMQRSASGGSWLTGDFIIYLIQVMDAPLAAILTAWLTARVGRKVKMKVGDVEVEASSPAQAKNLIIQAIEAKNQLANDGEAEGDA